VAVLNLYHPRAVVVLGPHAKLAVTAAARSENLDTWSVAGLRDLDGRHQPWVACPRPIEAVTSDDSRSGQARPAARREIGASEEAGRRTRANHLVLQAQERELLLPDRPGVGR